MGKPDWYTQVLPKEEEKALAVIRLALAALPKPEHTGSLVHAPGTPEHLQGAPLDRNTCGCAVHRAHAALHRVLNPEIPTGEALAAVENAAEFLRNGTPIHPGSDVGLELLAAAGS
jgi:hypothetical protein